MATETTPSMRNLSFAPEIDGRPVDNNLYVKSSTQLYHFGKRLVTWDGKVFRYSKSVGACYTGRGNIFNFTISSSVNGIDYSVLAADAAAGSDSVLMTNGTTVVAEDYFTGGNIVLKPTESVTDGQLMFRGVVGNTAAAAAATCRVFLDAPTETAMTTSNYAFVMPSPYCAIKYENTDGTKSFAGLAATYISGTGYYFWLQTKGKCWIAPQTGGPGTVAYNRAVYWRHDGTVDDYNGGIGSAYVTDQPAGWILDNNADANGATMLMLNCDIGQ